MYILFFFTFFQITNAYQLCVVGASSGLGRELVYQGALDRNISVLALTSSSSPIQVPCRVDSFQEIKNQPPFFNPNVQKENYWNSLDDYDYENDETSQSEKLNESYLVNLLCLQNIDLLYPIDHQNFLEQLRRFITVCYLFL